MGEIARMDTLTMQLRGWIEDYLLDLQTAGRSPHTVATYRAALEHLAYWSEREGFEGLDALQARALKRYTRHLQTATERWGDPTRRPSRPLSASSVRYYVTVAKGFSRWLVQQEVFERDPAGNAAAPRAPKRQPRPLTDEELQALAAACRADRALAGARDLAIVVTLVDTGLRVSELVKMPTAIQPSGAVTLIGKGDKERTVYLGGEARRAILRYLRRREYPHELLWLGPQGPLTPDGVRQMLTRRSSQAGIRHVNPHLLRHTFAVDFLRNKGNMLALMKLLGHTSLSMTQRYVNLADADLAAMHRESSPADRLKL